jgi:hypothetical protein
MRGENFVMVHPSLTIKVASESLTADDLFCDRHFLLLHDPSFSDVGGLFQSCQIIGDEAQGFFAHETPTRWQVGAAL